MFQTFQTGGGICPLTVFEFWIVDPELAVYRRVSIKQTIKEQPSWCLRKPSSSSWPRPFPIHITRHLVYMICDLLTKELAVEICVSMIPWRKMKPWPSCFLFCCAETCQSSRTGHTISILYMWWPSFCHVIGQLGYLLGSLLNWDCGAGICLIWWLALTKAWNICKGDTVSWMHCLHCWNKCRLFFLGGGVGASFVDECVFYWSITWLYSLPS